MLGHSWPCLLVFGDPARLGLLAQLTPPPAAIGPVKKRVLKVRVLGHFEVHTPSKQTTKILCKHVKNRFPATPGPVSDWCKLKLSLHGVALKFEEKKFRSFSKILEHCRDKNNNF